nr:hypothetical protein CFP56_28482 [Quercus suber]
MLQPTGGGSRRNGKQASCEPCRRAKIRCDHQTPTCGRCKRRGVTAECFYHPAPLTKTSFSLYRNQPAGLDLRGQPVPPTRSGQRTAINDTAASKPADAASDRLRALAHVITHVQANFDLIDRLLRGYYLVSLGSMIPGKILLGFLNALPDLFDSYCIDASNTVDFTGVNALAKGVLKNTAAGATLTPTLTVEEFIALFSGRNLTMQTLGLICNTAARSVLFGLARDDDSHEGFVRTMLEGATSCLLSAREVAPRVDDAMVWLAHENVLLFMACEGNARKSGFIHGNIASA